MQPGMRELKLWMSEKLVAEIKQVEIQGARSVPRVPGRTPALRLDAAEMPKEFERLASVFDFNDRVQEFRRVRFTLYGLRLVKSGREERSVCVGQAAHPVASCH